MPGKAHPPQPERPELHGEPEQQAPEVAEAKPDPVELERQLAEAQAERDQFLADLKRLAADFDNYRKRVAREQQALRGRAHAGLVESILPVLDDLERALEAATMHEEAKLEDGVRLVHRQLGDVLAREGLEEIATDIPFDPHVHEALAAIPSGDDEGTILEVVQRGYLLGERVLRPARVIVAAAPTEE
ncbi:MAG: nucleotide exchange factor GrpE [Gaiellaceae bacterium]|jgi:molecular chaperone GrpE